MSTVTKHSFRTNGFRRNGRSHVRDQLRESVDELFIGLLDHVTRTLGDEEATEQTVERSLDDLFLALRTRKLSSGEEEWHEFIDTCRRHPLKTLLHQDPFTYRAYARPRGYAGDAILMDYIYGCEERWAAPEASPVGRRVFKYTTAAPASEGVRSRRGFVADLIDRLAGKKPDLQVLSVAAGHLREANLSAAVRRGKIARFVAVDGDEESMKEVERCYSCYRVETVTARIRKLLANRIDLGRFDLVYTTGLFDSVEESTGRRLVHNMFQMLRPGGQLVVANFLPDIRDIGYMETFMDWNLVYRTRREMIDLTMEIPQPKIRDIRLFAEENQNIIFLQVIRN